MINLYTKNLDDVWFGVACDEEKIFATTFAFNKNQTLQSLLKSIPFNAPYRYSKKASIFAERVISLLKDAYDGKRISHVFSLATEHLSHYARIVIKVTSLIPLGYVAFYGSIAKVAGGSSRSVGRVMALNPFPLIVPCHRVVCSDFTLGGYGGGLDVKHNILSREKRGYTAKREISVNGEKLQVFPVELVLSKTRKRDAN
jgi:methylated-DNA-[protein]-cysteine S-methyltransferase